MGEITEVWNAVKEVATIMQNSQSVNMGSRAFAVPAGVQADQIDWSEEQHKDLQYTLTWSSKATEWGLSTGTSLRVGVSFDYGGRQEGSGRFLHNAYLWAILDYSGLGQSFDVTASFGDAYLRGQTGVLPGSIRVEHTFAKLHWSTTQFDVSIDGAGGGYVRRM